MRIALAQYAADVNTSTNIETIRSFARRASEDGARLLIAPEGGLVRSIDPAAEPINRVPADVLRAEQDLLQIVHESGVSIIVGSHRHETDRMVNVVLLMKPEGEVVEYEKLHLYDAFSSRESRHTRPGAMGIVTAPLGDLTLGLSVCYDLRFPELYRALSAVGADVMVVPAAWVGGTLKQEHWLALLQARAIENMSYVLGIGDSGERYIGTSVVFDPAGREVLRLGRGESYGATDLDPSLITEARARIPSLINARFGITLRPDVSSPSAPQRPTDGELP